MAWAYVVYLELAILIAWFATAGLLVAAPLSDPAVDAYNARVGTETFGGLYTFTTNTLLVETAEAITNLGSDTIKLYMGGSTASQSGVTMPANVTSLMTLARDEPSYRQVFDMPFRHFIMWAYPLSNPDAPFQSGTYTPTEQANDYREMYDLTQYFLTNYNNSGKTFYLGHWEGDGYLEVNNWTTNPSPAVVSAMIQWEINRQQAVDDAKKATGFTNVCVYYYAEANRVRDAMLNGATNNVRMIDAVIPYVTNLDYISYSSYDAENLSASDLYTTLNYMENQFPTNKAASVPAPRMWVGEYGWGYDTSAAQEPLNRAYIQRLLGWNWNGRCLPFILFWEIYNNQAPSTGATNWYLIDPNDNKVESWYLQERFLNQARLLVAQFQERNGRLPTDTEFSAWTGPLLDQVLAAPVNLAVANLSSTPLTNAATQVSGSLTQGVYGDDQAGVWVFWGRQDGGMVRGAWENSQFVAINTNFNPAVFSVVLANPLPQTNYYYRFYATNASGEVWAPAPARFSTTTLSPSDFACSLKITFSGYNRGETLTNLPVLVNLSTSLPGFSYRQFASVVGGDLRFTDASGSRLLPYEIDEWNTNGVSHVWVTVPSVSGPGDCIYGYWGNLAATNPPAFSTNGSAWAPNHTLVWHLKESGFPYADSAQQYPVLQGVAAASTSGEIGKGCLFNGTTEFLNPGSISLGNGFTFSTWANMDPAATNIQTLCANKAGGSASAGFALYINNWNTANQTLALETGDGVQGMMASTAAGAVLPGAWHHIACVVDRTGGAAHLYVDGIDRTATNAVLPTFINQAGFNLGRFTNNYYYFKGAMDEARLEAGTRSSNWVWASYRSEGYNSSLESYSTVTQQSPPLSLAANGGGLLLNWPGNGSGLALYSTTNPAPPAVWTPVTNIPALVNGQWQVPIGVSNSGRRFYRLQSQ
jgi:hypothetical protein